MFYSSSMSSEQKKGILTRQGRPVHRQTPPNLPWMQSPSICYSTTSASSFTVCSAARGQDLRGRPRPTTAAAGPAVCHARARPSVAHAQWPPHQATGRTPVLPDLGPRWPEMQDAADGDAGCRIPRRATSRPAAAPASWRYPCRIRAPTHPREGCCGGRPPSGWHVGRPQLDLATRRRTEAEGSAVRWRRVKPKGERHDDGRREWRAEEMGTAPTDGSEGTW